MKMCLVTLNTVKQRHAATDAARTESRVSQQLFITQAIFISGSSYLISTLLHITLQAVCVVLAL